MNLIIDQGNTVAKLAVFEQDKIVYSEKVKTLSAEKIAALCAAYPIKKGIMASVKNNADQKLLKKHNILILSHTTPLPLYLHYKTPQTLGADRIAAAVGAKTTYKNTPLLVIDIGTCITYDFINIDHQHIGGAISPGLEMRLKALHHFTAKLPLVNFDKAPIQLIGDTTETSIISGVYYGMKKEMEGIINTYLAQYEDLKTVVTGGHLTLFDLEPKNRIFADHFLVLKGLNEILNYNAK